MTSSLDGSVDTSLSDAEPTTESQVTRSSLDDTVSSQDDKAASSAVEGDVDAPDDDDDEDDELLALRIAALESIRLKKEEPKEKPVPMPAVEPEAAVVDTRPNFVITKHPRRTNLVSIITTEDEIERTLGPGPAPAPGPFTTAPPSLKINGSPPSPVRHRSPGPYRPIYRSRSRSWSYDRERRRSYSPPRRWSPPRRRSPYRSPPRSPGRRSPRRSPLRRSPLRRSPFSYRRSSPGRRSPRARSPLRRNPAWRDSNRDTTRDSTRDSSRPDESKSSIDVGREPSVSEWETDSDPPTDNETEANNKENVSTENTTQEPEDKDKSTESLKTKENTTEEGKVNEEIKKTEEIDASHDDVLKLDATAEVDEFSKFLNEFETEVLTDKKDTDTNKDEKPVKKPRIETERKTVDGKRLRKKLKVKTEAAVRDRSASPGGRWRRRRTPPQEGRRSLGSRRSPGARRSPWKGGRQSPYAKKGERGSRPRDEADKEKEAEREPSQERIEYEERLKRLPTPERERLEARRKKFESKTEIKTSQPKKISLRTESSDQTQQRGLQRQVSEEGLSLDISDTLDMFDDNAEIDRRKRGRTDFDNSPPRKKQVTDLRVQLHKRKQARMADEPQVPAPREYRSPPSPRTYRSPSPQEIPEEDDDEAIPAFKGRIIVPPEISKKKRGEIDVEEESEGSPSPPAGRDRRILVRKDSVSPGRAAEKVSPKKATLKSSLQLRLGDKLEAESMQFTEEEIWAEMMRQKQKEIKKKQKKLENKKEKIKKKKKKKKKDKKVEKESGEEDEEIEEEEEDFLDAFERELEADEPQVTRKRLSSGDSLKIRWSSEEKSRHSSGEQQVSVKERLGDIVGTVATGEKQTKGNISIMKTKKIKKDLNESLEDEDIMAKMRRRNEKRLQRLKEIELDKMMFS